MTDISVSITIRDLVPSDLDDIGWSGSPSHLSSVQEELGRVASGGADGAIVRPRHLVHDVAQAPVPLILARSCLERGP